MMGGVISTRLTTLGLFALTNQSIKDNEIGFRYHDSWKHFILRAGYYTMGERLDYPSVSHISSVAQVHFSQIRYKDLHIDEVGAINILFQGWQLQHCLCNQEGLRVSIQGSCQVGLKIKNLNLRKPFPVRSLARRTLQCWSRTPPTSSTWWRAATRASPPLSRWSSTTLLMMQFQGGKPGDKWKDWTSVPNRLQPGRSRKVAGNPFLSN